MNIHGLVIGVINVVAPMDTNDPVLQSKLTTMLTALLASTGEIVDVRVICDETNNPPHIVEACGCPAVSVFYTVGFEARRYDLPSQSFPLE